MVRQGRIIDIATAQPLDLAYLFRVVEGSAPVPIAQADASGRFSVDLPANVSTKIRAERVGYRGYTFDVPPGNVPLEIQLQSAADLDPVIVERERPKAKGSPWILLGLVALFLLMDDE